MFELVQTLKAFKKTFDEYAAKDGIKGTLSRRELAYMLRTEFDLVSSNNVGHLKLRSVNAFSIYFEKKLCFVFFLGPKLWRCGTYICTNG